MSGEGDEGEFLLRWMETKHKRTRCSCVSEVEESGGKEGKKLDGEKRGRGEERGNNETVK